jgi:hypothetical protein
MKIATRIRFTAEQLAALDALSQRSNQPLAALVRWCVDNSIARLTANIDANLRVPTESTIDNKLNG